MTARATTTPATTAIHVLPRDGLVGLDGAAPDRRREIDERVREKGTEQQGTARIAVGGEVHAGPDRRADQHRMAERAAQVGAHVRGGEQDERHGHRDRCDGDGRGNRREQLRAGPGAAIADDDQHQTRQAEQRKDAAIALVAKARGERTAR